MDECIYNRKIYLSKFKYKYNKYKCMLVHIRRLAVLFYERASRLWVYGYLYYYRKLTCLYLVAASVQGMFLENYEAERPFKLI